MNPGQSLCDSGTGGTLWTCAWHGHWLHSSGSPAAFPAVVWLNTHRGICCLGLSFWHFPFFFCLGLSVTLSYWSSISELIKSVNVCVMLRTVLALGKHSVSVSYCNCGYYLEFLHFFSPLSPMTCSSPLRTVVVLPKVRTQLTQGWEGATTSTFQHCLEFAEALKWRQMLAHSSPEAIFHEFSVSFVPFSHWKFGLWWVREMRASEWRRKGLFLGKLWLTVFKITGHSNNGGNIDGSHGLDVSVGFWDVFYRTMLSVPPAALWAEQFHFIGEETSSETWISAQVTELESGTQFCVQTIFS